MKKTGTETSPLDQIPMDLEVIPSASPLQNTQTGGDTSRPTAKRKYRKRKPAEPMVPPEQQKAMETTVAEALLALIALAARHPVDASPDERAAVGSCAITVAETYLPGGASKHLPAFALVGLLVMIGARTFRAGNEARREKENADSGNGDTDGVPSKYPADAGTGRAY